jgi:hypothetical protein
LRRAIWSLPAVLVAGALLAAPAGAGSAASGGSFFFGFTEDAPKERGAAAYLPARDLGASAFRITVMWDTGQTQPTDAQVAQLERAIGAASGIRVVLAVYADTAVEAPQTAAQRNDYCTYVRNVLVRYPSVRDVVIWNEPNAQFFWRPQFNADGSSAAPAAYQALVARCWDVLHASRSDVNVIAPVLAPRGSDNPNATSNVAHSPGNFLRKLGDAYRTSGRTLPLLDTVGHHAYGNDPAERPWRQHIGSTTIAQGDWNKLMQNLSAAFAGTAQPIPGECRAGRCVSIWYMEAGWQTAIDEAKSSAYTGRETQTGVVPDEAGGEPVSPPPSAESPAPDQATQIRDAARLAYCQPYVEAFFNFLLADEPRLEGWQSGPYWADWTAKDSLPAYREVVSEVAAGRTDCDTLKGGRPSADWTPPPAPLDLAAAPAREPVRIELTWRPDPTEPDVVAYRLYRDGGFRATTSEPHFTDAAVVPGRSYRYVVRSIDRAGNLSEASAAVTVTALYPVAVGADFDGDGRTDIAVWRPSDGIWYPLGGAWQQWGASGDVPVPGNYDADAAADPAVWRPSDGVWYVPGGAWTQWGRAGDVPVPGDYDGNGRTDPAVWRPTDGVWYLHGGPALQWGVSGDVPVPADYDGDGDADIAVWRPTTGVWYVRDGQTVQWGRDGDVPVPADYDGDGDADVAVWRPSNGVWYVRDGAWSQWGAEGDVPAPGDYDGNGTIDPAVFRASTGTWYVRGGATAVWGVETDSVVTLSPAVRELLFG